MRKSVQLLGRKDLVIPLLTGRMPDVTLAEPLVRGRLPSRVPRHGSPRMGATYESVG